MIDEGCLVNQYHPLVQGMARRYGYRYSVDVDELVQEGYLALILAGRSFDPHRGVPLAGYLKAKVEQRIWGFCRRELSRKEVTGVDDIIPLWGRGEDIYSVESVAEELFAQLPPKQRQALFLIYWEDQELETIANQMGVSPQAVWRLKHRGLKKLKKYLEARVD